jgi:hypothetical protein
MPHDSPQNPRRSAAGGKNVIKAKAIDQKIVQGEPGAGWKTDGV